MHGGGPADRVHRSFRESEVAHLARRDEFGHRPDGLLDGHVEVGSMLVVEVDVVDTEPAQRAVDRRAHVLRRADDDRRLRSSRRRHDAELGGHDHLVPSAGDCLADGELAGQGAVDIGGVEQRHTEVEGAVDDVGRIDAIEAPIGGAEAHAAEPDGSDRWAVGTERASREGHHSHLARRTRLAAIGCRRRSGEGSCQHLTRIFPTSSIDTDLPQMVGRDGHPVAAAKRRRASSRSVAWSTIGAG